MHQLPALDRITVDPGKCGGKPCIPSMRITVRRVLDLLASYNDRAELFRDYPFLDEGDLIQALTYAATAVDDTVRDIHLGNLPARVENRCCDISR